MCPHFNVGRVHEYAVAPLLLRVVDASVFLTKISGHLTVVIHAITEKTADAIKKNYK